MGIVLFFSFLLKFIGFRSNLMILEVLFINSQRKYNIWGLIKVLMFNFILAHIIATILLAISRISPSESWVEVKLVGGGFIAADEPWHQLYLWSYYWAATIMMTIGFGDFSPVTYREAICVAFVEIFGAMILAYNINEIGGIVSSIRSSSDTLQRKYGVLRRMMMKDPIPEELNWKIESYLGHEAEIKEEFEYEEHR